MQVLYLHILCSAGMLREYISFTSALCEMRTYQLNTNASVMRHIRIPADLE